MADPGNEPGKSGRRVVPPSAIARLLLADLQRLQAHARHPAAQQQPPERLAEFFAVGLEAVTKAAGVLVVALERADHARTALADQSETKMPQRPNVRPAPPELSAEALSTAPLLERAGCSATNDRGDELRDTPEACSRHWTGSPAELAGQVAAKLRELAELAVGPDESLRLPTFADELQDLAEDQTALAAHLAEIEEADEEPGPEILQARNAELIGVVRPAGQDAPLTFEALNRAVELLTHDAQARLGDPRRTAARPASVAGAVDTVQAATKAVGALFKELNAAADKAGAPAVNNDGTPATEPAGLQAVADAVDAAIGLVFAFQDVRRTRVDLPLRRLIGALRDVQRGIKPELLTPIATARRTDITEGAHLKATAVAALHARLCAGIPPEAAAGEVAALIAGVRQTRSEYRDSPLGKVRGTTVRRWRYEALRGELTPADAQARFDSLAELFGIAVGIRPKASPPPLRGGSWGAVAAALDVGMRSIVAGQPPGFTLSGAVLTKRQAERDAAAEDAAECGISGAKAHRRIG